MPRYSNPPISEHSIAVQFSEPLPVTPVAAVNVYREFENEFPVFELQEPIGALGATPPPFRIGAALSPRYWLSSEDGYDLLQFQADMIAFNWRKRSPAGEKPSRPYPGFAEMIRRYQSTAGQLAKVLGVETLPSPNIVSLYYDNVWPLEAQSLTETFKFWNRIGIELAGGIDVKFQRIYDLESSSQPPRIDVNAVIGVLPVGDTFIKVGRLMLAGFCYPKSFDQLASEVSQMHDRITETFESVTTEALRETWR